MKVKALDAAWRTLMNLAKERLSYIHYGKRIYSIVPNALRAKFWVIMPLTLLRAVAESSTIFVIAMFARSVSSPNSLRDGRVYRWLVPDAVAEVLKADQALVIGMCCLVVLFILGKNIVACVTTVAMSRFSELFGMVLTRELYRRYLCREYLWHSSRECKDFVTRMGWRNSLVSMFSALVNIVSSVTRAAVMFSVLLVMNFWLTLALIAVFALVSGIIYAPLTKRVEKHGKEIAPIESRGNWTQRMATNGIREIIIYEKQRIFLERLLDAARDAMPHRVFLATSGRMPGWILETAGFLTILGAMIYLVLSGRPMPMIVASMSMMLLTAWRGLPLVSNVMSAVTGVRGVQTRALACLELLESFSPDGEALPEMPAPGKSDFESIEFRNAGFRYDPAGGDALSGITLRIDKGEQIGIIGRSGSGKTTLAMLLAGLFAPSSGEMLLNGAGMDTASRSGYRRSVGFVPQNPLLISGTMADNVAFGDFGGQYDMAKVERVCGMAAMNFLGKGRRTLQSAVGDGGSGLSGGEAQRISIARALYTEPAVIVFDEATSSLDQANENAINKAIASLRGTMTCIVIAHRLGTVEKCDRIIWLGHGTVKRIGPPAEIIAEYLEESDDARGRGK